jgi:hypothetical protein
MEGDTMKRINELNQREIELEEELKNFEKRGKKLNDLNY